VTICDVFLKDCIAGDVIKWSASDGFYEVLSVRRVVDF